MQKTVQERVSERSKVEMFELITKKTRMLPTRKWSIVVLVPTHSENDVMKIAKNQPNKTHFCGTREPAIWEKKSRKIWRSRTMSSLWQTKLVYSRTIRSTNSNHKPKMYSIPCRTAMQASPSLVKSTIGM